MANKPKKPMGRPASKIDWEIAGNLLMAGCLGTEIAAYFGLAANTLYERCKNDLGIHFSEFMQEKRAKGETLLRAKQYEKALGKSTDGDNTMLVWLGKNRLGQSDKSHVEVVKIDKDSEITQQDPTKDDEWIKKLGDS